ncbi:MAG: hypothetical protein K2R98_14525 [Gemmataceae bacterium]|nr:hypothetical protein [Gemmataceae bacterium]
MPVFPSQPVPVAGDRDQIVETLARELEKPGEVGEPLIFENPIQFTDKFFVVVIWSAWAGLAWSQRPAVILDAYRKYDQEHPEAKKSARITTASGMTWEEADLAAFFPYSIAPNAHSGMVDPEEVKKVMLEEGGIETPTGTKLRFKLRESAEKAYSRLEKKLPSAGWALIQVIARVQDD